MRTPILAATILSLAIASPAVAEDPPAKPAAAAPVRRAKIENPLLTGLVGDWELQSADGGETPSQSATVRWSFALDGTALVEEAGAGGTSTFSVLYVDGAGTGVSVWRFHSENPGEVMPQKGTLSEAAIDLASSGNLPGLQIERKKETVVVTRSFGTLKTSTSFRKARTRASSPGDGSVAKHPFLGSLGGDFTVEGTMKMGDKEFHQAGSATISAAAGGTFSRTDYQALAGQERKLGLGVSGVEGDGRTFHYWWFTDHFDAPTLVSGEATDPEWKGKGEFFGPFDMTWTRTETGLRIDAAFSGATLRETFTRKK
jgi:hypothetical protein